MTDDPRERRAAVDAFADEDEHDVPEDAGNMGLIYCMECRREVSDKAGKCPHCGAPFAAGSASWVAARTSLRTRGRAFRVLKFVLLAAVLGGAWWIWQAATSDKQAPFSAGFSAAFREPRTIVNERPTLAAGRHIAYAFTLRTDSRVHLCITAVTCPVDMMLMPKAEADRFRNGGGDLFAGGYSGHPALSGTQVGILDKTEVVGKGDWALVVSRPKAGAAGPESAGIEIALTVY